MNILFDIGHPAHVHLFKNFIRHLESEGHKCVVVIRDKDIIKELLDAYKINYYCLSTPKDGLFNAFLEFLTRTYKIIKLHWKYKFDMAFGTSVSIGFLSFIFRNTRSYNFNEDDDDVIPLYTWISYPFCNYICIPDCLKFKKWKKKRLIHNSYHELAYLHPKNFSPDKNILKKYNLKENEFIIARFSALKAHHDINAEGISKELWAKIEDICKDYKIIKSIENEKNYSIQPEDMHHVMAFAKMVISDSQTMTAEAAVLGIPSIRYNSFVGSISYLSELENKYFLSFGFMLNQKKELLSKLKELLFHPTNKIFKERRKKLLSNKVDLNKWLIENIINLRS